MCSGVVPVEKKSILNTILWQSQCVSVLIGILCICIFLFPFAGLKLRLLLKKCFTNQVIVGKRLRFCAVFQISVLFFLLHPDADLDDFFCNILNNELLCISLPGEKPVFPFDSIICSSNLYLKLLKRNVQTPKAHLCGGSSSVISHTQE